MSISTASRGATAAGMVNVKYAHTIKGLKHVKVNECGHPVPDTAGVEGARAIGAIAEAAGEGNLVIAVISGGASALLPAPAVPVVQGLRVAAPPELRVFELDGGAGVVVFKTVDGKLTSRWYRA